LAEPVEVRAALAEGYPLVCATCQHLWDGRQKGLPTCTMPSKTCAGPSAGRVFHDYKGPLNLTASTFCFVCGDQPDTEVRVNAMAEDSSEMRTLKTSRKFGICQKHDWVLKNLRASYPVTHEGRRIGYEKPVEVRN
jgi:hypothetical protein